MQALGPERSALNTSHCKQLSSLPRRGVGGPCVSQALISSVDNRVYWPCVQVTQEQRADSSTRVVYAAVEVSIDGLWCVCCSCFPAAQKALTPFP